MTCASRSASVSGDGDNDELPPPAIRSRDAGKARISSQQPVAWFHRFGTPPGPCGAAPRGRGNQASPLPSASSRVIADILEGGKRIAAACGRARRPRARCCDAASDQRSRASEQRPVSPHSLTAQGHLLRGMCMTRQRPLGSGESVIRSETSDVARVLARPAHRQLGTFLGSNTCSK